jgi:hypothetical protein
LDGIVTSASSTAKARVSQIWMDSLFWSAYRFCIFIDQAYIELSEGVQGLEKTYNN